MKITLEEALSILGIESFTTQTWKTSTGAFREFYSKEIGETKVLMMSNEFDSTGKGRPDANKEIWVTILDNKSPDKYDYVMQFSNKAPAVSAPGQTYGKGE